MHSSTNTFLLVASALSAGAALMHFACIFLGAACFRYLGAGDRFVRMANQGHWYPRFVAFMVGALLSLWSLYALSGAGAIPRLPFVVVVLIAITMVYLLRAVSFPILRPVITGNSDTFWYVSSLISLVIGLLHLVGLVQVWEYL
jgi:hypothetical protein